jgi:tetratricopeptide (TPR) repeat protein
MTTWKYLRRMFGKGIREVSSDAGLQTDPHSVDSTTSVNAADNLDLLGLINQAKVARAHGDLLAALDLYSRALRTVTPDDTQIDLAIAIVGIGGKGKCDFPVEDKLDSRLRSEIVSILIELRRYDEAYHHACIALYLDMTVYGRLSSDTSASYHDMAMIHKARRQVDEAIKYYRESEDIDKCEAVRKENPSGVEFRALRRAAEYADLGYIEEAARFYEEHLNRIDQWDFDLHRKAGIINAGTQCLQSLGEHALAQKYLKRGIAIQQSQAAADPLLGVLYSNLACLLHERCDFKGADEYDQKVKDHAGYARVYDINLIVDSLADDRRIIEHWLEHAKRGSDDGEGRGENDFFLSFSIQDDVIVEQLCRSLESFGLSVWKYRRDQGNTGQLPRETIINNLHSALDTCRMAVIVSTGASIASEWVYAEIRHALDGDIPVVVWYPDGLRLCPLAAATWTNTTSNRLRELTMRFFGPGIYSYFGYGLRERNINVIADAIIKRFALMFPNDKHARSLLSMPNVQKALDGTRMPPVFVDQTGKPLVPETFGIGG